MFHQLKQEIVELNRGVKTAANGERAKKLKKKLLSIGLPMALVGFLGVFVCFVLIATAGFAGVGENGFTPRLLIPFFLFLPCGVLGGVGLCIAQLGFRIHVTQYTSELVDEAVGKRCPSCEADLTGAEAFCPACGKPLALHCPSCGGSYAEGDKFCAHCGSSLQGE